MTMMKLLNITSISLQKKSKINQTYPPSFQWRGYTERKIFMKTELLKNSLGGYEPKVCVSTFGDETFHLHHIPHRDTVRSTRIRQPEQSPDVCFHPDENRKHRLLYKSCNDRKYSIWCSNLPITFHIVSKLFIKNESRIFISVKVRSF